MTRSSPSTKYEHDDCPDACRRCRAYPEVCKFEGITISDFARSAILEKVEDSYDLQELREAIAKDDGERFSIDDILGEL
ncbi:DUF6290 family protein [Arcanobacterium canis]|uniref:DUF6290 family protein n=1 Tax=Arcanobacterium canis TaxID=999183 RepID=A0ABY8G1C3_9ACTO|nr:DUF6290 family protein [Arcanobacterium canis]WFM83910.1 DUF6290 family protein [Arcanobacterium canis]